LVSRSKYANTFLNSDIKIIGMLFAYYYIVSNRTLRRVTMVILNLENNIEVETETADMGLGHGTGVGNGEDD
jgi:hypothetical protein